MKGAMEQEDVTRGLAIVPNTDSVVHGVNNKVLPINDAPSAGSTGEQCGASEKKEKLKIDKVRTMSRMKELLKRAATTKVEKSGKFLTRKVLNFRHRGAPKAVTDDDQLSNNSPKISFRWDLDSCSTASSSYSAISMTSLRIDVMTNPASSDLVAAKNSDRCCHPRKGNWITTDTEFVVLEL